MHILAHIPFLLTALQPVIGRPFDDLCIDEECLNTRAFPKPFISSIAAAYGSLNDNADSQLQTNFVKRGTVVAPAKIAAVAKAITKAKIPAPAKIPVPAKAPVPAKSPTPARASSPVKAKVSVPGPAKTNPLVKPPVKASLKAPIKAPTKAPLKVATAAPSKTPASVKISGKAQVKSPAKASIKTTSKVPTKAPAKAPIRAKTPALSKTPIKTKTANSAKTPGKTQVKAPAKAPVKATPRAPAKTPAKPKAANSIKSTSSIKAPLAVKQGLTTPPKKQAGKPIKRPAVSTKPKSPSSAPRRTSPAPVKRPESKPLRPIASSKPQISKPKSQSIKTSTSVKPSSLKSSASLKNQHATSSKGSVPAKKAGIKAPSSKNIQGFNKVSSSVKQGGSKLPVKPSLKTYSPKKGPQSKPSTTITKGASQKASTTKKGSNTSRTSLKPASKVVGHTSSSKPKLGSSSKAQHPKSKGSSSIESSGPKALKSTQSNLSKPIRKITANDKLGSKSQQKQLNNKNSSQGPKPKLRASSKADHAKQPTNHKLTAKKTGSKQESSSKKDSHAKKANDHKTPSVKESASDRKTIKNQNVSNDRSIAGKDPKTQDQSGSKIASNCKRSEDDPMGQSCSIPSSPSIKIESDDEMMDLSQIPSAPGTPDIKKEPTSSQLDELLEFIRAPYRPPPGQFLPVIPGHVGTLQIAPETANFHEFSETYHRPGKPYTENELRKAVYDISRDLVAMPKGVAANFGLPHKGKMPGDVTGVICGDHMCINTSQMHKDGKPYDNNLSVGQSNWNAQHSGLSRPIPDTHGQDGEQGAITLMQQAKGWPTDTVEFQEPGIFASANIKDIDKYPDYAVPQRACGTGGGQLNCRKRVQDTHPDSRDSYRDAGTVAGQRKELYAEPNDAIRREKQKQLFGIQRRFVAIQKRLARRAIWKRAMDNFIAARDASHSGEPIYMPILQRDVVYDSGLGALPLAASF